MDAEGRPITLSATGFHSVVGQIRDNIAGSEALRDATSVAAGDRVEIELARGGLGAVVEDVRP